VIQQPLENRCPGKVLYESGLYLVKHIRLTRTLSRRVPVNSSNPIKTPCSNNSSTHFNDTEREPFHCFSRNLDLQSRAILPANDRRADEEP
jgi:hypothetical protein